MVPAEIVATIRRLLAAGELSQRAIARHVAVSRGVVAAVAAGKEMACYRRHSRTDRSSSTETGAPRRCPGCGGLAYFPCRLCRVRAWMQRRASPSARCPTPR
jgi:hypothetical protein